MIDSHHHFWHYNPTEYDWIGEDMACLQRNFLPADFKKEIEAVGVTGVVSVQARQTLEETDWLLDLALDNPWILGVVGWVPLAEPTVEGVLQRLSPHHKLKAIRHVVQAEATGFLDGGAFNRGIALLERFDLVYDLLVHAGQLEEAIRFVDRHPHQVFVLDHIAKPRIKESLLNPWQTQIRDLARRENVVCKVSGMVTEADWNHWTPDNLRPYFDTVLDAFGPSRLMFGSDWPVCQVACEYGRWTGIVRDWAKELSQEERDALFSATSRLVYRL